LSLHDETGQAVLSRQLPPVTADFPTSQWQTGDMWRGQHALRLPAGLESGTIPGSCNYASPTTMAVPRLANRSTLGELTINAPERSFTPPELTYTTETPVGDIATLLGAVLTEDEGAMTEVDASVLRPPSSVDLIWRAEAETAVSYRVFLHLVGPDGALMAQSDGEPAQWQRPTTGWLPGEIIRDTHYLLLPDDLPARRYTLLAGLYHPLTGERLPIEGGETSVVITHFGEE
jgi:hypothetical protein